MTPWRKEGGGYPDPMWMGVWCILAVAAAIVGLMRWAGPR